MALTATFHCDIVNYMNTRFYKNPNQLQKNTGIYL
jgi:hypothetical protein